MRAEAGLTYRRFRTLLVVGRLGTSTQRHLADSLGVSEPSASRMTRVLVETGLLDARDDPDGGNRRRLRLTREGAAAVERCRVLLEARFSDLVRRSGVSYEGYARDTRLLIDALDPAPQQSPATPD